MPFARAVPADGGFDVAAVVQHDLEGSGRFRAMRARDMLTTPTSAKDVQAADWKAAGNDYVVVGRVSAPSASELDVECDLINIQTGARVASQKFIANSASLRNAAHLVSDFIYGKILGVRGAFATRIAYVAVHGQPPSQRFQLVVADADGENPQVILESRAADHVAGVVAGRAVAGLRLVREPPVRRSTCSRCAPASAAGVGPRRRQRRAGVFARWHAGWR